VLCVETKDDLSTNVVFVFFLPTLKLFGTSKKKSKLFDGKKKPKPRSLYVRSSFDSTHSSS